MRLVKSDLRGLNSLGVYLKGQFVLRSMTGNPHFPAPSPSLATLEAAVLELRIAIANAINGGKIATTYKEQATRKLADVVKAMAGYVGSVAQGNAAIAMSAGYELRDRSTRIGALDTPRSVRATSDALPGQVSLRWSPVRGARIYQIYGYTEGQQLGPMEWRLLQVSSGSRCTIKGLQSCHYHMFRVQAVGVAGAGPMSQPGRALVA